MKKIFFLTLIISILFIGCATNVHHIGNGPQIGYQVTARQFYLLWGLVPVNTVDTNNLVGVDSDGIPIANYEIKTQTGPVDIIINSISFVTTAGLVTSRTITITK